MSSINTNIDVRGFTQLSDISAQTNTDATKGRLYKKSGNGLFWKAGGATEVEITNQAATAVSYDNTTSGLTATNVQTAIDEVEARVDTGLQNVVEDTTPQLGGMLDVNGQAIGDGTLELVTFTETGSAVNHVNITNAATAGAPVVGAAGDDTNIDISVQPKGTGNVVLGNFSLDGDQTVGAGQDNYVLTYDNGTGLISLEAASRSSDQVVVDVQKESSGTINVGQVVYVVDEDTVADTPTVELADSSTSATMPALGIAISSITQTTTGQIVTYGKVQGLDTSATGLNLSLGDVYVSETAGGLTNTRPTGTALVQKFGRVIRVNATQGEIIVFGAGRENALPNLPQYNTWVGDATGVPEEQKNNYGATTGPTSGDDSTAGYGVGSIWIDTTNDVAYICVDATASNAVWNIQGGNLGFQTSKFSLDATVAQTVYSDDKITLGWSGTTANDIELTMDVAPSGTGDLRANVFVENTATAVSTPITTVGFTYDIFPSGLTSNYVAHITITSEDDVNYPLYDILFHNNSNSFNIVGAVRKYSSSATGGGATTSAESITHTQTTGWNGSLDEFSFAHGFGGIPDFYRVIAVCISDTVGYVVGDEVDVTNSKIEATSATRGYSLYSDTTNVYYRAGNIDPIRIPRQDTGISFQLNESNWNLVITAYKLNAVPYAPKQGAQVLVRGQMNSLQAFTANVVDVVEYDDTAGSNPLDVNGEWDLTNHRFTVASSGAGTFLIQASTFIDNGSGWSTLYLYKNGTVVQSFGGDYNSSTFDYSTGTVTIDLVVGDYIDVRLESRDTGGTMNAAWYNRNMISISKISESQTVLKNDTDAIHDNVSGEIAAITEKATPVGADLLVIEDSAASNTKKRVQISNLPLPTDGDKGDITVSASGATWTIDNDAVTYAKIQNVVADNVILGNNAGAGGIIDELTATEVRTLINVDDGANNYSHPNHTGDVTSVGDGATTIANNVVTNAKAADMAAYTIKLRNAGTSGDPGDVKVSTLTEEAAPTTGDWALTEESGGALRKVDLKHLIKPTLSKTFNIEIPTASEDVTVFRTDVAITVVEVIAVSTGTTPSVTYQLKHDPTRSNSGNNLTTSATTTSTGAGDTATLSDATIPADSWVWLETTAQTGTVDWLSIDIRYTED